MTEYRLSRSWHRLHMMFEAGDEAIIIPNDLPPRFFFKFATEVDLAIKAAPGARVTGPQIIRAGMSGNVYVDEHGAVEVSTLPIRFRSPVPARD